MNLEKIGLKNKKILLISSILLTLCLMTFVIFYNANDNTNNIISNINKDKQVINSNMITMMYETEAGSGEYTETADNTWPETGYIFNENLSGCENGGELEYNSGNNTVNLLSNASDRCYVYFDKYDGVWIDNVVATNITGSTVTLDVSATSENGSIITYYYAINDGEYISTTSNPIVINDLNKLTEYKISIFAVDSTNAKSNIYEITVNTTDESKPVINSVEVSDITYNSFTLNVNVTNNTDIIRYYYIIEDSDLSIVSNSNKQKYTNLQNNTNYNLFVFVEDINGNFSDKYQIRVLTKKLSLADYIKSLYTVDGNNYLYLHDGQGSYTNASQEAEDNSYRYAGASDEVNNYVCFGSDTEICSEDNLYRIIGVFDNKTKLIKADYDDQNLMGTDGKYKNYTYYDAWGNLTDTYYKGVKDITKLNLYVTGSSYWSDSQLNTINLNYNFLNTFTEDWKNKISSENWIIGGNSIDNIIQFSIKNVYLNEIVNPTENVVYNTKIGLIYISDYGYAASPENWTTILSNYNNDTNRNNNWMYMGLREWSITRCAVQMTSTGFVLEEAGNIGNNNIDDITFRAGSLVRPVFYLNSDVEYVSGTGTQSDPIRIN